MASDGGNLHQCLSEINRANATEDFEAALKAANRIIRKFPNETIAHKCKIVALIRLEQFSDALAHAEKTPPITLGDVGFEKAYALYRLNKNTDALEALEKSSEASPRVNELKGQILYRLERFEEAAQIYQHLVRNHSDANDSERLSNFIAVKAQLRAQGVGNDLNGDFDTFEQLYNAACYQIEAKNYKAAHKLLVKAYDVGVATLQEQDAEKDEIEDELANVRVNTAYTLQKFGQRAEALKIYNEVNEAGPSDVSVKATILNNIIGASEGQSLGEWRKKIKAALALDQNKLTLTQRSTLHINQALALFLSNQREPCRRALEELKKKFGVLSNANLVEAALLLKNGDTDGALALLDEKDEEHLAIRAHILLASGKLEAALDIVHKNPALSFKSLSISLLTALGRIDEAVKASQAISNKDAVVDALAIAAEFEMSKGNHAAAIKHLEQLDKISDDVGIKVQLIRAYSVVNPAKAEQLTKDIFPTGDASGFNIDELEESDWILYGMKYKKKEQKETQDTEIVTGKMRARKRKRKVVLPKNYDPNVAPDPERWLPKQERSTWKTKKNKKYRDRDVGRGTQGAANSNIEYKVDSPRSPLQIPLEGPRQQKPVGAKSMPKKKKKTGKR